MKTILPECRYGVIWRKEKDACCRYNGWPTVCRDENGILYAAASSMRITHIDPSGKNCLWISRDEGLSWSSPILINDSLLDDRDTGIVSLGKGRLLATWFSSYHEDHCRALADSGLREADKKIVQGHIALWESVGEERLRSLAGAYAAVSEDGGLTWSAPFRVPLTSPHGPAAGRNGELLWLGKRMTGAYDRNAPVEFCVSSDGGRSWEKRGTVPPGEDCAYGQMHEPHVAELQNGRLLGAVRVLERGSFPKETVYLTFSDDGGRSWSVPKSLGLPGIPPHLLRHSCGAVVLSYACRIPGERAERAAVSFDGGESWETDFLLDGRVQDYYDLGYPSSAELSDGSLLTVYYQALPGDDYTSILSTRWRF